MLRLYIFFYHSKRRLFLLLPKGFPHTNPFNVKGATSRCFESFFLDGLNCGSSVGKPKNYGLLRKKNSKGLIVKQKGTRMAEDGED